MEGATDRAVTEPPKAIDWSSRRVPLPGGPLYGRPVVDPLEAGLAPVAVMVRASPFTSAVASVRVTVAPLAEAFVTVSALAEPPEGVTVTEYPAPPVPLLTKAIFRSQRWPPP